MTSATLRDKLRKISEKVNAIPSRLSLRPWQIFLVEKTFNDRFLGGEPTVVEVEILPIPKITELTCGLLYNNSGSSEMEELKVEGLTKEWFSDNNLTIPSGGYFQDDLMGTTLTDRNKSKLIFFKITGENFGPDYYEITGIHKLESVTALAMTIRKIPHG